MAWVLLAAFAGLLLYALVSNPLGTLAGVLSVVALGWLLERQHQNRTAPMRATRVAEDIGTFARAFDRKSEHPVDPWAIRAVWNALYRMTDSGKGGIALRPTDRPEEDLGIDLDDLEVVTLRLVEQCQRDPDNWSANPYYKGMKTVGDLVHFISAQPLRPAAPRVATP